MIYDTGKLGAIQIDDASVGQSVNETTTTTPVSDTNSKVLRAI